MRLSEEVEDIYKLPVIAKETVVDLFKQLKSMEFKYEILQASATLYPDKIIIETIDRLKDGGGISSVKITTLPLDIDSNTLGSSIRHHLNLTETILQRPEDWKKHYTAYLKKMGFKNGKEHHKNALSLSLQQKGDTITIIPTKNGGFTGKERGFLVIKESDIIVSLNIDNATLGDKIKYGWTKCQYNSI